MTTLKEKLMIHHETEQDAIGTMIDMGWTDTESQNQEIVLVGFCGDGINRAEVWECGRDFYYINAQAGDVTVEGLPDDFEPLRRAE